MRTLCFIVSDEQAGSRIPEPARPAPTDSPGGSAGPGTLALAVIGVGVACLWLASVLLVSGLMARLQLGYWPDASFCGLAFGAGMRDCMAGDGALPRLAGFLLDQVDAAAVIGVVGALLVLAGSTRRI